MARKAMRISWLTGVFAIIASFALACAFATSAFAASGSLKVVTEEGNHSYQAYKLFVCDVDADGSISNVSTDGCMPAGFYEDAFASSRPQEMAEEVSRQINGPQASAYAAALSRTVVAHSEGTVAREFQTGVEVVLESGVYLLISHDAQPILVTIGGNAVVVNEKSTLPNVTKEVASVSKGSPQVDAASFGSLTTTGVGKQMAFRVTGTLPSNYEAFDSYSYAFIDTPSEGVVIDPSSVLVYRVDVQGQRVSISEGYTVSCEQGVLRVAFEDLKRSVPAAAYGDKIVLEYRAELDVEKAQLGYSQGNTNSVVLEYRRSPSFNETATTKPGVAKAFAFALNLVKVDASDPQKALSGARFELKDEQGAVVASGTTDGSGFLSLAGLAPGTYRLEETAAPAGYKVPTSPIKVEIGADVRTLFLSASVSSGLAKVVSVDADGGLISLSIANEQATVGATVQTGDRAAGTLAGLAVVALGSGLVVVLALLARRKHRRNQAQR